jgi:hypothetical protein
MTTYFRGHFEQHTTHTQSQEGQEIGRFINFFPSESEPRGSKFLLISKFKAVRESISLKRI